MFFEAVILSHKRADELPGQKDGIVLHSTAKFQKTNHPNSLHYSKSISHRNRGDAARRGQCWDKDTPQFATRCHSSSLHETKQAKLK